MFTGIIEEMGIIERVTPVSHGRHFRISAIRVLEDLSTEDSISVSGVCLTTTKVDKNFFDVTAVDETLQRSTLSELTLKSKVNLERALRFNDRLGGHLVQGHIDGIGNVRSAVSKGASTLLEIEIPKHLARYIVEKGSIAIDGISLTIAKIHQDRLTISIIPYTLEHTTLGFIRPGCKVNLEVDMFSKYAEKFFQHLTRNEKMGENWYRSMGY